MWSNLWRLLFFGPSRCSLWAVSWFHPFWLCWDPRTWCILRWAWCHTFFHLLRVSMLSTIFDNYKPWLSASIQSCKLWCTTFTCTIHWLAKCQLLNWFAIFQSSSNIWILGFLICSKLGAAVGFEHCGFSGSHNIRLRHWCVLTM